MVAEKAEKIDMVYRNDDQIATQKDLKILGLELEHKILQSKMDLEVKMAAIQAKIVAMEHSLLKKLGGLIISCSGILFALLSYFHR